MPNVHSVGKSQATFMPRDPVAEQVGHLAPIERRMLAEEDQKRPFVPGTPRVVPVPFVSREERDRREIEIQRQDFIEKRVDALLKDKDHVGQFVMELIAGPLADHVFVAFRDAIEQEGKCWDGISSLNDMIHSAARVVAAGEWPAKLEELKPLCCSCAHANFDHGNETSERGYYCKLDFCLWS